MSDELFHFELKDSSIIIPLLAALAVIMTLQTTVIFVVVLVVGCRLGRKKTRESGSSGGTSDSSTPGGVNIVENQYYESVNLGRAEVTTQRKNLVNAVPAKRNEAYDISQKKL